MLSILIWIIFNSVLFIFLVNLDNICKRKSAQWEDINQIIHTAHLSSVINK
jgi:hypothetical protein